MEVLAVWKREVDRNTARGVFVIIHGAGEYHVRYKWVAEKLNSFNFHVIFGDLPGQGTTEGPRGHITKFENYITEISAWVKEAESYNLPVILLGHSMGGLITTRALMEMKEQTLPDMVILSSPCFGLFTTPPLAKKAVSYLLNKVTPGLKFPSGLEPGSGTRDPYMRKRDESDNLLVKHVSIRWYRELEKAMTIARERTEEFPDVPLLLMQGGDDRIVDKYHAKEWFDKVNLSDKYYKEWEGLYHEVLNEPEKNRVLAHMLGFVFMHLEK
nr:alpha/beta hydrolase [Salipaludibacillus aurantiacus]